MLEIAFKGPDRKMHIEFQVLIMGICGTTVVPN